MYKRFEQLILEKGITPYRVSKDTGIATATLSDWKNGKTTPKTDKLQKIADYLNVSLDYLSGNSEYRNFFEKLDAEHKNEINELKKAVKEAKWSDSVSPIHYSTKRYVKIPVYGSVPAGIPIEAIEDIVDYEDIDEDLLNGGFEYAAMKVKGDSMYPKYMDGDTIIVKVQADCETGEDAVVYVNGYDATLKTLIKNDNHTITLKPINPEYVPKTYGKNDDPISLFGVVVELRRTI